MAQNEDRRGFLRGLATLPLIGGAVTLIGRPSAAAEPITPQLLDAYDEWLDLERSFLKWERYGAPGLDRPDRARWEVVFRSRETGECWDSRRCGRVVGYPNGKAGDSPSSRAAVILAAAGCDWRRS